MTPQNWERAKTIFGEAIEQDPVVREGYVRAACQGDETLFREVMSLLEADSVETKLLGPLARKSPGTLKGRYRVERVLGRGGLGMVYLSRDETLHDKPVVIKMPIEASPADSWLGEKFAAEVKALAMIDHPGVVGALDSGTTDDGRPFLVMQYVEGRPLSQALSKQGVPFPFAAQVLEQIGQALAAAHAKGIWHRDLKPANIMLQTLENGREHVRLIDFGIASIREGAEKEVGTKIAGTPPYMSPEQLEGRVSAAADIFAMGVIAYELVTGHKPFVADSMVTLHGLQSAGAKRPSELRPDLPPEAERLILQSLAFRAEDRPKSAAAFGEALARALTPTVVVTQTIPSPSPRPRGPIVVIAALVLLLAAAGVWWKLSTGSGKADITWSMMVQPGAQGPASAADPAAPLRVSDGFFLVVRAPEGGYIYLLSDDPAKDSLNTLGSFQLRAGEQNKIPNGRPLVFDVPDTLNLWCVWSRDTVPELEGLARLLNEQDKGVLADRAERTRIRQFLKSVPPGTTEKAADKSTKVAANGSRSAWRLHVEAK
jgi:serine/threonine-protein kinase